MRLRKGNDFPYAVSEGFSEDFLQAEGSLAPCQAEGEFCRDDSGPPRLECACGLVLSGQTDPADPLFTPGGSAWTNDVRRLLDLPADQDPRWHPRNRCVRDGYRSVALIPIRVHSRVVGLLQLNDRRTGCFSLGMIQFFEGLASSLGVTLMRLKEGHELREAERRYRGIFENAVEGIYQADLQLSIRNANPAMAGLLGFTSSTELIDAGSGSEALLFPVESQRQEFLRQIEKPGFVTEFEHQVRRSDGRLFWVTSNVRAVRDTKAQLAGYEGTMADITARKQAEEALLGRVQLEDQLTQIAASVPGLIYSLRLGLDGVISVTFTTLAIVDLCGLRPEDVREGFSPFLDLVHPNDKQHLLFTISESARTLKPWSDTFRLNHPVKGEIWLEGQSVPRREADGCVLWHGFVQDVTGRKRLEQEREAALVKYRSLFDSFPIGIMVTDREGRITESNRMAEQLLGSSAQQMGGREAVAPSWCLCHEDGTCMAPEDYPVQRVRTSGQPIRDQVVGVDRPDGSRVWALVNAYPEFGELDGLRQVVVTFVDIDRAQTLGVLPPSAPNPGVQAQQDA